MNGKPIDISKSSLLSLKAEVLRKQEEINKSKLEANYQRTLPQLKKKLIKNRGIDERNKKDEIDNEIDQDVLSKSRQALEAKAKLYDQLSKGEKIQNEDLFLVQFDKKAPDPDDAINDKSYDNEIDQNVDPGDEWVEYTDCLGRSRKCLRKDLAFIKSRDKELISSLPPEKIQNFDNVQEVDEFNTRITLLREQWEKKEQELLDKKNIHYQDVLFNEARSHGVGYFNFSQDEQERLKQQAELKNLREETKTKQSDIQKLKEQREKQIAARMKAARNRKRARMGLPPEEDVEEQPQPPPEADQKEPEKEEPPKEAIDKENELNKRRSQHVRPWDIGKAGVREVKTQEQWVKEKREERPKEFAPPTNYSNFVRRRSPERISESDLPDDASSLYFTTKKSERTHWKNYLDNPEKTSKSKKQSINPYKRSPEHSDTDSEAESPKKSRSSHEEDHTETSDAQTILNPFTSEIIIDVNPQDNPRVPETARHHHPKCSTFQPTPIVNEIKNVDLEQHERSDELYDPFEVEDTHERKTRNSRQYAEIPPPPTFEYYGPTSTNRSKPQQKSQTITEIRASIEAGLKYLRKQSERKHAHTENVGYFD